MILKILKYPNPILMKKTEEVREVNEEIKKLIEDMKETLNKHRGLGLAAPQVGVLKRVIVVETNNGKIGFLNPKILKTTKETEIEEEGCLSFPGLFLKIKRPRGVEIEALNEKGEKVQIRAEGLLARIFQHEIDHLDGILFIDRLSFWHRLKIKKIWKNLKKYGFNQ